MTNERAHEYAYSDMKGVRKEPTLTPTVKYNWRSPESRDQWQEFMASATETLHQLLLLDVIADTTETQIVIIEHYSADRPESIDRFEDTIETPIYTQTTENIPYPHVLYRTENRSANVTVIGTDKARVQQVASGSVSTKQFAEWMNIPMCCREQMCDVDDQHGHDHQYYETIVQTATETTNGIVNSERTLESEREVMSACQMNPTLNTFWTDAGPTLLTYMPCSFTCENAVQHATQRYQLLEEHNHEMANTLGEWLKQPLEYDSLNGVGHIKNEHLIMFFTDDWYWDKRNGIVNGGIDSLDWKEVV